MEFSTIIGYLLGILFAFVIAKIFLKPLKFILKVILNSVLAFILLLIINKFFPFTGILIGANPITSVIIGLFGVPGLCLILVLQILF